MAPPSKDAVQALPQHSVKEIIGSYLANGTTSQNIADPLPTSLKLFGRREVGKPRILIKTKGTPPVLYLILLLVVEELEVIQCQTDMDAQRLGR